MEYLPIPVNKIISSGTVEKFARIIPRIKYLLTTVLSLLKYLINPIIVDKTII
jgi:hypothetical protein